MTTRVGKQALVSAVRRQDQSDERLGPQLIGESGLAAAVRRHQSQYRHDVLGLSRWGFTPPPRSRPLGSILHPEDAARGLAFVTTAARQAFVERRVHGWGVDPFRIPAVLTSSQGLTINLFGPLKFDLDWATDIFRTVLTEPTLRVTGIDIEAAPRQRSKYLGDMTRIDALVRFITGAGRVGLLAVEVKLSDRWSSRHHDPRQGRYRESAELLEGWSTQADSFADRSVNQLLRVHLLVGLMAREMAAPLPRVLVLSLDQDSSTRKTLEQYRKVLRDERLLINLSLSSFVNLMERIAMGPRNARDARAIGDRYVLQASR